MDNDKKVLGKKRLNDKIIIEKLEDDSQKINPAQHENNIIKDNPNIISPSQENLNLNLNINKNNALSFGEIKTPTAFINKLEPTMPLNSLNLPNNTNSVLTFGKNPSIQVSKSLLTFGKNPSIQVSKSPEKIDFQNPINNSQINQASNTNKKSNLQNSSYSENSDYDSQSQEDTPKNSPKIKSHYQSSRNTAFGLKEISKRVMEIIKQSGKTTYKAISDQIVNEISEKSLKDEKNIRRRIYDSLNVMKSMRLFNRDKNTKTIMWNYGQEYDPLDELEDKNEFIEKSKENKIDSGDIAQLKKEIKEKSSKLELLRMELIGLKNVLERNAREKDTVHEEQKLYFPFIFLLL